MKKETSDNSYRIELVDMEFFARHGCFDEEQMIGNKFLVNLKVPPEAAPPSGRA